MSGKFCVYVHHRESDGLPFYVGKGDKKRSAAIAARSDHWRRVYLKHGRIVRIPFSNIKEFCAFSLEKAAIAFYGRGILVNATDGGEGTSGRVVSQDQRTKCSQSNKGKPPHIKTKIAAKEKNSKPVGTECGLRFASAADAGRIMFPHNPSAAKVMISACCNARRTRSVGGYKFGFLVDGEYVKPNFQEKNRCVKVSTECGMTFDSSVSAANWLRQNGHVKAQNGNIIQCCKGRVMSAYGYSWRYA